MKPTYYNEIDPFAAQCLRNLIGAGLIAPGDVDERSIEDVRPIDLKGYVQCHFFAGIGVWSYALRQAGWDDSRSIWTASCPCQPFSAAGKGDGFDDKRHLWPSLHWLIQECRPTAIIGEQVAGKDADPWIDLVQTDMEAMGYAFGAVAFPSAGVGAPHIRDRTYWVADAADQRQHGRRSGEAGDGRNAPRVESERLCDAGGVAHADNARLEGRERVRERADQCATWADGMAGGLADADRGQRYGLSVLGGNERVRKDAGRAQERGEPKPRGDLCERPGPTNGLWRDADWLLCRDGKWRPVEPGTFPLAHGAPARVGRLRAYGNAINAEAATTFIKAYRDIRETL